MSGKTYLPSEEFSNNAVLQEDEFSSMHGQFNEDPEEFWGEMERLDAQISYTFQRPIVGSEVSIYANFNNITDETDVRFAGNGTINQSESYGSHYLVGIRVNY